MYIHDMNCGWMNHPFMNNNLKIRDDATIEKVIRHGISEVYIDTDKGLDVIDAPTQDEVNREIEEGLNKVVEIKREAKEVPLKEELVRAVAIKKEAKQTITNIMDDVRFVKQIRTEQVENVVEKMVDSIFRNHDALVSLGRIRKVDEYTYVHSMAVSILMISFGRHLGLDQGQLMDVGIGAMLHDIGKTKVPPEILKKREPLTDEELDIVRGHVNHSRALLEETEGLTETAKMLAAQHHERVDGTGYPEGLGEDEIHQYGKMVAITDVYDAMTSKRCYQSRNEPTQVLRKLYEWSGTLFDRELVQQFVRCIGIYPVGSLVHLEQQMLGVVINHGVESLLKPLVRVIFNIKRQKYISPFDVDLSQPEGRGGEYRILTYASQDRWNIKPELYL